MVSIILTKSFSIVSTNNAAILGNLVCFENLGQNCSVKSVHKGKIHWILLFDLMQ